MSDLIDRQEAIDDLGEEPEVWEDDDEYGMGQRSEWRYIKKILEKLPSVQSERKTGKWIDDCTCSVCYWTHEDSNGFALLTHYNYCPNCGADMRCEQE